MNNNSRNRKIKNKKPYLYLKLFKKIIQIPEKITKNLF